MSFMREPNAEPLPGYRLIEPLGSGGFGEAWKCEAPGGLFKAIKFVFGNLNSLDVDGARADQELKALNRIKEVRHPFILSMDRIEVVEGELVIVMELADRSLHDRCEECISAGLVGIPRDELLRYTRDAAEALDHMNEKHGLQHLDIKPRNLFLVSDRVKVADFGLVKHLERSGASGVLSGGVTPLYAPPETFSNTISGRSDQYSLAIVYQELLTGQRPFTGKNARQLAQQHLNEDPDLRSLPEAERPVVARALAKEPAKRFPNCLAFVRALYQARSPVRGSVEVPEAKGRPKTMADTMEDVLLEQMADGDSQPLDVSTPSSGHHPRVPEESRLGVTVAAPQTGALRPTLVIGVGNVGRRALLELRCRFLDRFGDLDKVPLVRFLYLDTDPDAVRGALRGSPEVAFRNTEVHGLPLQAVSHYRRRQLDQLNDWLPREKLYAMPRSLKTHGSRALGRLAFSDHYQRLLARIKRELQQATNPDAIYQTVTQTGLALRDSVPRVYVLAAATGGSSGYLADLGYAVRRILHTMRQPESPVTCLLFCGAPDDPATPPTEQANLYATLTELNHFADPFTPFAAQYGTDGPRLTDEGAAFDDTYLLTQSHRTPEGRRDTLAHLSSYLFHELTTPLGLRLDQARHAATPTGFPFRSLGTYGVWFPRGLLLRLAARSALARLLEEWQTDGDPTANAELEGVHARILADPELFPEALTEQVAERARAQLEGTPREVLTRMLSSLEEQSQQMVAQDDPGVWARQAVTRVRDWLGSGLAPPGVSAIQQRKSRLTKALEGSAAELAEEWDRRLAEAAAGLMEHPGRRLAVAEAALNRFVVFCEESAAAQTARVEEQAGRSQQAQEQLHSALENCLSGTGGFSWFGGRSRRLLRVFMDHLAAFARQCLVEDTAAAVLQFFAFLRGRLSDRLRDLTFCRQRLRHLAESMASGDWALGNDDDRNGLVSHPEVSPSPTPLMTTDSFWESIRESATTRVVLPEGESDLEQAARHFVQTLTAEQWTQLDQVFQDQVLAERGGLFKACMSASDLVRHLAVPLLNQAVATLSDHLPVTDVAQVELSVGVRQEGDLAARIQAYHARSATLLRASADAAPRPQPVAAGGGRSFGEAPAALEEHSYLLIPASESGRRFGEEAQELLPEGVQLVNVPGQADLMFCRDQSGLSAEELGRFLRNCRKAYEESAAVPNSSPHARFDIQDWTPLDP
ncbi:MAG TPA: tubulin-like doman-containing protein [Gemmataceae bacterium]|nr:tubulin-like doman-containing protein [Gemmataceae bacterium]